MIDQNIYLVYYIKMFTKLNRTDKLFSKHPFMKKLFNKMHGSYGNAFDYKGLLDVMKDMCRYKNMRMNLSNYRLVEKQEVSELEDAA
jgi:hypothetical protein